jgi:hypothetical protein
MDFREFVLLCEIDTTGHYFAYLDPQGKYQISPSFPNAYERDVDLHSHNFVKAWPFEIPQGAYRIDIPGTNKYQSRRIQYAFWDKYGFNRPVATKEPEERGVSDVIDPEVLDPDYWKKVAAAKHTAASPFETKPGGTISFKPKPA